MSSIVIQGDTSGSITVEAPSVAGTHTLTLPKATGNIATDATVGLGMKNRIINGNMAIDQRNNGSSATANANAYFVDRLQLQASGSPPVLTGQRVTDAPNDFKYSMKFTTNATTDTLTASEAVTPRQNIEGFNVADFNFGNANAKEFTVSFWVKGSVTGTYGFCVMNAGFNRHYVTTYNINSANTWEKKTITLTADTSGTWDATTGVGVRIMFPIDTGPDMETTTTETWGTGDYRRTSSCVKLLQTSSATWQITGLQDELGSTATPFENRMYGTELALCQRYCQVFSGALNGNAQLALGFTYSATLGLALYQNFKAQMRALPSLTASGSFIFNEQKSTGYNGISASGVAINQASNENCHLQCTISGGTSGTPATLAFSSSTSGKLIFSAEL